MTEQRKKPRCVPFPAEVIDGVLTTAARAPSILNTQPWMFKVSTYTIELYADRSAIKEQDHAELLRGIPAIHRQERAVSGTRTLNEGRARGKVHALVSNTGRLRLSCMPTAGSGIPDGIARVKGPFGQDVRT